MYLFYVNGVQLPVPPEKMEIKYSNKNKTIQLINEGEVNIIKKEGLIEISFEALLPNQYYPFSQYDGMSRVISSLSGLAPQIKGAKEFVSGFKLLKETRAPVRLVIVRMTQNYKPIEDTVLNVTLEDYSVIENAENGNDLIVPLRFKQYKKYGTKEVEFKEEDGKLIAVVKPMDELPEAIPPEVKAAQMTTVWEACKRVSDGALDWREIASINGISDVTEVPAGTVLKLFR